MVEPVMYFGIGFLVAALIGLLFVPLVHNRAVRLTMRRLEAATPLSMAEIRADKDQLRAEFAMSTRRLEMSVEQMKTRTTTQLAELGKKTEAITLLKKELGEKTSAIFALESRDRSLREQLRATEEEFEIKSQALREAERALADKEAELAKLLAELGERSIAADSHRVELASLRTNVEAMKVTVGDYERSVTETKQRLARERAAAQTATDELERARGKLATLAGRTAELERQLAAQRTEAESLNRRVRELESLVGEQTRLITQRDMVIEQLTGELEAVRRTESDLRGALADIENRNSSAAERRRSEVGELEAQLAAAIEERSALQHQIVTMKREAENAWAAERVENAMLRERINDVAAEVARLTAVLEGPDFPIESMLAVEAPSLGGELAPPTPQRLANGRSYDAPALNGTTSTAGAPALAGEQPNKPSLADRIRALQSAASRVASN